MTTALVLAIMWLWMIGAVSDLININLGGVWGLRAHVLAALWPVIVPMAIAVALWTEMSRRAQ